MPEGSAFEQCSHEVPPLTYWSNVRKSPLKPFDVTYWSPKGFWTPGGNQKIQSNQWFNPSEQNIQWNQAHS